MTQKNRERDILKRVYVNEHEDKQIKKRMAFIKMKNFSNYARHMLLHGKVIVRDYDILKKITIEVNRIGVNINQIAKVVNENQSIKKEEIKELYFLMDSLEKRIKQIIQEKDGDE